MTEFEVRLVRVRIKDDWEPHITLHALLRYLERAKGVDVAGAKRELISQDLRQAIALGRGFLKQDGFRLIIERNRVVTVLSPKMRVKKEKQPRPVPEPRQPHPLTNKQRRMVQQMLELKPQAQEVEGS